MLALPHSAMKLRKKGSGGYGVRPCHSQIKGPSCTLHALLNLEVSLKFDMGFLQTLWGHDPTLCGCHARSRWPLAVSGPWQRTSWIRGGQLCSASVMGETPLVSFLCKNSASCSIMPNQNSYHECLTHLEKTKWAFVRFSVKPSCLADHLGLSDFGDFLCYCKCDDCQSLTDGRLFWALPVHDNCFSDFDHISRSQLCQTIAEIDHWQIVSLGKLKSYQVQT